MGKITAFPNESWTPEQTLIAAQAREWTGVMIIGYGPDGQFQYNASGMTNKDALYAAERAKLVALGID